MFKNNQRFDSIPTEQRDDIPIDQPVDVQILKGGYWHDTRRGRFQGWTPKGRVRVKSNRGVRAYSPANVQIREIQGQPHDS